MLTVALAVYECLGTVGAQSTSSLAGKGLLAIDKIGPELSNQVWNKGIMV